MLKYLKLIHLTNRNVFVHLKLWQVVIFLKN